jgi:hypothetical protein
MSTKDPEALRRHFIDRIDELLEGLESLDEELAKWSAIPSWFRFTEEMTGQRHSFSLNWSGAHPGEVEAS